MGLLAGFDRRYLSSLAGVVIGTALAWGLLFAFWPAASPGVSGAGDRLVLAAGLLVWPALLLLVMVFAVALTRLGDCGVRSVEGSGKARSNSAPSGR